MLSSEIRTFYMDQLESDKDFIDDMSDENQKILELIGEGLVNPLTFTVSFPMFNIPNEIAEFLDGNGFTIKYEDSNIYITKVPPKPKLKTTVEPGFYAPGGIFREYRVPKTYFDEEYEAVYSSQPAVTLDEIKKLCDQIENVRKYGTF